MDFEAFKALKAESETETFFDQLMRIHREIDRIDCLYSGYPVDSKTTLQQKIQAWFDDLSDEQKADPLQPARGYLSNLKEHQLEPLEAKSVILEAVLNQMKYEEDAKEWLRPAMSSLRNKSTQDLQTIQGALSNLNENQFNTFLDNFDKMASRIAGQNRNRLTDTYEILMDKLAEQDGNADIRVQLNAAYDEVAQKCQNLNPLQRGLSALKGFLSRKPSLQTLPQTLVNPFASEAHAAVSDASAGGEASDDTVDGTENQQSTPDSSQQHQNPLQKLGQRITSLPWIGRIKTGAFGIAAAAVITTHPLRQWIGHQRKGTLILGAAGGVTAAAAGIALVANAFRGNGGNGGPSPAPAADPASTTPPTGAPTPSTPAPESGTAGEALLTKFDEAIKWRSNPGNFGDIPGQGADHPLRALLKLQGKEGLASSNAQISGGTRRELTEIANRVGIDPNKILTAYQTGYDDAYINAYASSANVTFGGNVTESVHAHAMTKSLEAVKAVIAQEQEHKTSFLGRVEEIAGNILPKGAPANAAEGPPAMPSSTAPTHESSSSGVLGQGLGMVSATMATVQLVSTWKSIDTKERLLLAAQATAGALAAAGKTNPALTSALFVVNTVRASTAEAYETRTTTLATKQEALQSTLATQAGTLGGKAKKYAAVAWNAFQVTGATVSVVQSVAANGVRDFARPEDQKVVQPMMAEKASQARDAVVHQTSQMLTQAQEVTGNAVASTRENLGKLQERFANLFNRQTTAAL